MSSLRDAIEMAVGLSVPGEVDAQRWHLLGMQIGERQERSDGRQYEEDVAERASKDLVI